MEKIKNFQSFAYKKYSQNKEDGLLDEIFNRVGFKNRKGLEMCCGSGAQCNLTNLIIDGKLENTLYIDKNTKEIEKGELWWDQKQVNYPNISRPKYLDTYIKKDTINKLLKQNNMTGELDIFSLDMDGIDYWILKEVMKVINPRVIVLEFQDIIGPNYSLTVPFKEPFSGWNKYKMGGPNWSGASLKAFKNYLSGYDLVGIEPKGFNAFFIRKDVNLKAKAFFPIDNSEMPLLWKYRNNEKNLKLVNRWKHVKELDWQEV